MKLFQNVCDNYLRVPDSYGEPEIVRNPYHPDLGR